jgi:hypothetical protein
MRHVVEDSIGPEGLRETKTTGKHFHALEKKLMPKLEITWKFFLIPEFNKIFLGEKTVRKERMACWASSTLSNLNFCWKDLLSLICISLNSLATLPHFLFIPVPFLPSPSLFVKSLLSLLPPLSLARSSLLLTAKYSKCGHWRPFEK